jgi:hypothetical protein
MQRRWNGEPDRVTPVGAAEGADVRERLTSLASLSRFLAVPVIGRGEVSDRRTRPGRRRAERSLSSPGLRGTDYPSRLPVGVYAGSSSMPRSAGLYASDSRLRWNSRAAVRLTCS